MSQYVANIMNIISIILSTSNLLSEDGALGMPKHLAGKEIVEYL
jgi:hypothetical protein